MVFLESEFEYFFNEEGPHPSMVLEVYRNVYPHILEEGPDQDPEIEVSFGGDYGIAVDQETLLTYIRGLRVLTQKDGEVLVAPVFNKLGKLFLQISTDYSLKKDMPLGRATSAGFVPVIFEIELVIDKPRRPKLEAKHYATDIGLSFFLDYDELDWIVNFWRQFDKKNPKHQEINLNHTLLHEIAHLEYKIQRYINLFLALEEAAKTCDLNERSKEDALAILGRAYDQARFHTIVETSAETYAIRALKLIYETQKLPKIITITDASKFFAALRRGCR